VHDLNWLLSGQDSRVNDVAHFTIIYRVSRRFN
jgi:hypothetical protein